MKRSRRPNDPPSLFHILMGEPDDDCEICRAHGLTAHDLPPDAPGMVIPGTLDEILRCPCPLCAQISLESFDDPAPPDGIREE